ncbi:hypothetical protein JL720_9802 [Aureococcus anophagefferens]|nr:hypothetical protein JL720_9802 [Aureococcus anophagefferens]
MPQERYLFRGSLLNKANTDKDFLLRYAEDELTNGSKDGGDKLPEIRKRAKEAKEAEEEDERMQRNSVIDMTALMKVKNVFKNKICGDIFSSAPKSYDGVLYKSRITTSKETSEAVDTMTMDMDDHDDDSDSLERGSHDSRPMSREAADELMKLGAESSTQAELEGHDIEAVSSDDESEPEDMTQRQQLAVTLRNYCKREGNVGYLLEEGAVVALCGLASIDDDRIRCACAVALSNLTRRRDHLQALLASGVMVAVLQLATSLPSATSKRNALISGRMESGRIHRKGSREDKRETSGLRVALHCARTLANLSCCAGGEASLVGDGMVPACRLTLAHGPRTAAPYCVQALYNLTTVAEPYDGLDTVIKAVCAIPLTPAMDARQVAVGACCNASVFFKLRSRLLEAGALQTLATIVQADAVSDAVSRKFPFDSRLRNSVSACLHNLASARACRSDMVARGAVPALALLANDEDPELLSAISATLSKLTRDVSSRQRLVNDGGLETARAVALHCRGLASATQPLTEALLNMTRRPGSVAGVVARTYDPAPGGRRRGRRTALGIAGRSLTAGAVDDGSVDSANRSSVVMSGIVVADVIIALARVNDVKTRRGWARALAQILDEPESHGPMLTGKALTPVINLMRSLASAGEACPEAAYTDPAAIEALALGLYYMTLGEHTERIVVDVGVGSAMVDLPECLEVAMAVHGSDDVAAGDRKNVMRGLLEAEDPLKERVLGCVSHALCNLTVAVSPSALKRLVDDGALKALTKMLKSGILSVQASCATALANIAFSRSVRDAFTEGGMWSPITDVARVLIRHTHEDTDLHGFTGGFAGEWVEACNGALVGGCCAALASLSFEPEARAQLQEAGALGAVLEICLTCQSNLTSVVETITTRRCATTLCNISSDNNETRRCQLVEQGIVSALARLSESYSEDMQNDIARCLCNLACAADTPQKMVEQGAVQILMMISMMRAVAVPTRRCCAQAFWNICTPPTLTYLLEAAIEAREREARRASVAADDAKKKKEPGGGGLRALQPNMGFVHAFALLAAQDDEPTLALVGALFAAVADRSCGRRVLVEAKNKVLHGMYTLLRSRTRSTRLTAGLAVCSLLTHGESAPEAVRTGGLNVVKVLAIQGDDDAALASAHALAALGARGDPYEIRRLVNDGVAPVPVHLIMSHGADVAMVAVRAITCLAIHEELRAPLVKAGAATALVSVCLRDAATRDELADALARGLLYLASSHDEVPAIVSQRAVTALPAIVGDGGAMLVVEQICGEGVTAAERAPVAPDAAVALANLARTERLATDLLEDGAGEAALVLTGEPGVADDRHGTWRILTTLFHLTLYSARHREQLIADGAVARVAALVPACRGPARQCAAAALCNLSFCKAANAREAMVEQGAVHALVHMAEHFSNETTQNWCSVALSNLSSHTDVQPGDVAALLGITFGPAEDGGIPIASLATASAASAAASPSKRQLKREGDALEPGHESHGGHGLDHHGLLGEGGGDHGLLGDGLEIAGLEGEDASLASSVTIQPKAVTRAMSGKVRTILGASGMGKHASVAELLKIPEDDGNLLRQRPPEPDWFSVSREHHEAFATQALRKMASKACADTLPPRRSAGLAEQERGNTMLENVTPPALVETFMDVAVQQDTIGGDDAFAADDIIPIAFPKLPERPDLAPPAVRVDEHQRILNLASESGHDVDTSHKKHKKHGHHHDHDDSMASTPPPGSADSSHPPRSAE